MGPWAQRSGTAIFVYHKLTYPLLQRDEERPAKLGHQSMGR
jgi:hypothetical protein